MVVGPAVLKKSFHNDFIGIWGRVRGRVFRDASKKI